MAARLVDNAQYSFDIILVSLTVKSNRAKAEVLFNNLIQETALYPGTDYLCK